MIRKLVISNGRSERELLLVGNIVIGRDPACHVSEPDPLLSRRHAEVLAGPHGGVTVRDLNSRNGMLVNGEKTHERVLLPGDVVQLGGLQLRYVEEQPRPAEAFVNRSPERRIEPDIDRFRPDPAAAQPSRWKPEPTPLPGRRSTAPAPMPVPPPASRPIIQPPPPQARVQNFTPVPRGKAAFHQEQFPGSQPGDQTIIARPGVHDTTLGTHPVDMDATILAPMQSREPAPSRWPDPDATVLASAPSQGEHTMAPGQDTFQQALAHLAGLSGPAEPAAAGGGPRIVANAELTITDATPDCADLLGMPGESLVGDSLADVFLRAVRRPYSDPATAVSLSIARSARGSIVVTLSLDHTGGTE